LTALNAKQAVSVPQGQKRSTVRRVHDPANFVFDGIEGDSIGRLRVQRVCCVLTLVGGRTPLSW
jgi:hypothetical protein